MILEYALLIAYGVWNVVVFLMYGIDKQKARRKSRRISEKTLILSAAFMGALGALAGMCAFHHKTRHLKFKVGVPALLFFNYAVIAAILWFVL